jgi:hypothetical protein
MVAHGKLKEKVGIMSPFKIGILFYINLRSSSLTRG